MAYCHQSLTKDLPLMLGQNSSLIGLRSYRLLKFKDGKDVIHPESKFAMSMNSNQINPNHPINWPTACWNESTAQEQGMLDDLLRLANERIRSDLPNVYSLLVIRNGAIVFEQYYQGYDATSLFDVRSV